VIERIVYPPRLRHHDAIGRHDPGGQAHVPEGLPGLARLQGAANLAEQGTRSRDRVPACHRWLSGPLERLSCEEHAEHDGYEHECDDRVDGGAPDVDRRSVSSRRFRGGSIERTHQKMK